MTTVPDQSEIFSRASESEAPSVRRVIDLTELGEISADIPVITDNIMKKILWGVYDDNGDLVKLSEFRDVKRLMDTDENARAFQDLYLKGLREEPSAFGSSYEIESKKSMDEVKTFLKDNHVVGIKYAYTAGDAQGVENAEQKEQLVAIASFKREEGVESHIARFGKLYVHPDHRIRALSANIMQYVLDYAAEIGVEQVHLIVTTTNTIAIKSYEKLGFVAGQIRKDAVKIDGQYYDWLPMMLSMKGNKSDGRSKNGPESG